MPAHSNIGYPQFGSNCFRYISFRSTILSAWQVIARNSPLLAAFQRYCQYYKLTLI